MQPSHRYDVAALEGWCGQVLQTAGLPQDDARTAAALIVRSDLRGQSSHGLARLPTYVDRFRVGDFNPRPAMQHRGFPGGIVLDADGALGHVAAAHAIGLGLAALAGTASVHVVIRSCGHLGALKVLALRAAEAGAMCMMGQTTPPLIALEGFHGPAIGTNPLAFACPVPGAEPMVFDMSSSVAARGRVASAARAGAPIPSEWALDEEGRPTTDARAALRGALQPAGGAKGLGIAMMVQCLAGALSAHPGAIDVLRARVPDSGAAGRQDAFVWLLRPGAFAADAGFAEHMHGWIALYRERGGAVVRLPGGEGASLEARTREEGLLLDDVTAAPLRDLAARLALPFPEPKTIA